MYKIKQVQSLIVMTMFVLSASSMASQTSSTATGVSRLMNPAISVNGLFLGTTSRDNPTPEANGIFLQEAEVQFSSVVD
ncbi:MAG: hypothetical protein GY893_01145, partial [bacterium]|nr:hypothetical protein [bacterium]